MEQLNYFLVSIALRAHNCKWEVVFATRDWPVFLHSFIVFRTFTTQEKWNPIHTLALSGMVTFMDKLLEDGLDIDVVDKASFMCN